MRAHRAWVALGVLVAPWMGAREGCLPARADEGAPNPRGQQDPQVAVDAALAAAVANDDAALARALAHHGGDPVALAADLLLRQAEATAPDPPTGSSDALHAAARLASVSKENARAQGLDQLVAAWRAGSDVVLQREREARSLRDAAATAPLAADQLARLRGARGSPAAVQALFAHAMRLRTSGADRAAVDALREAATAADGLPWPLVAVRIRRELVQAYLLRDAFGPALETADACLAEARRLEAPEHIGVLARARAGALLGLDRPDEALAALEEAYVGRPTSFSASVESQRAGVLSRLGRRREAVALGERVLASMERAGNVTGQATALNSLAAYEAREGRLARALTLTQRALDLLAAVPPTDEVRRLEATSLHNLATAERSLGRPERALELFALAARRRVALKLMSAADRSAGEHALALEQLGRLEEALRAQLGLAARARERRQARAAALADARTIGILARLGRTDQAQALARAALAQARAGGVRGDALDALELARARLPGDLEARLAQLDGHLAEREATLRADARTLSDALRARLLHELGRADEASAAARRSLDVAAAARLGLGDHDLERGEARRSLIALALELAHERASRATTPQQREAALADALHASESARALTLLDGLANRDALLAARAPPAVLQAVREARRRLDESLASMDLLSTAASTQAIDSVRQHLLQAEEGLQQARARLRRELRFAAEAAPGPSIRLEALQRALGSQRAYVAFEPAGDQLFALLVTERTSRLQVLGTLAQVDASCGAWLDQLASGADDQRLARSLYDQLVRPFEADLPDGARLLIAPDAARARLAFAALLRVDPTGRTVRLVERHACTFVPSATTWFTLHEESRQTPRGKGALVVGRPAWSPDSPLPDLPASDEEARRVASRYGPAASSVLIGEAATRDALLAALAPPDGRWAAVHIATHALMDDERPSLSALVLAHDERLTLDDLSEGGVSADLAVLSACETAVARELPGEGPVGFPRRLFLAGCPRVIVTAWPVSDGAGVELVDELHRRHAGKQASAAAALADAQRARLRAGDPPSAWAGFLLWGLDE